MMKETLIALIATLSFSILTQAATTRPVAAVDSHHCAVMQNHSTPFVLALRKGDKVQEAITRCANDAKLNGAALFGIGAVEPVTLRYYDHIEKKYKDKPINEFMEVTNLSGNISFVNGKRQNHIHITLSDKNFKPQAGHLKDATVAAVLEILVTPLQGKLSKVHDQTTGLDIFKTS